jgi:hypothetical protein
MKFLSSKSLFVVSKVLILNMLPILLGLVAVSFTTCKCMLQAIVFFLFSNCNITLRVLCELVFHFRHFIPIFVFLDLTLLTETVSKF